MKYIRSIVFEAVMVVGILAAIVSSALPSLLQMGREARLQTLIETYDDLAQLRLQNISVVSAAHSGTYQPFPVNSGTVLDALEPHHELVVRFHDDSIVVAHRGTPPEDRPFCSIRIAKEGVFAPLRQSRC